MKFRVQDREAVASARRRAAAWAWYMHGGGREERVLAGKFRSNQMRPPCGIKLHVNSKPSRFFFEEQERQLQQRKTSFNEDLMKLQWDCGSVLFDSYELVMMSTQLDRRLDQAQACCDLGIRGKNTLAPDLKLSSDDQKQAAAAHDLLDLIDDDDELQKQFCFPVFRKKNCSGNDKSLLSRATQLLCTSSQHHHHFHYHHHFHHYSPLA